MRVLSSAGASGRGVLYSVAASICHPRVDSTAQPETIKLPRGFARAGVAMYLGRYQPATKASDRQCLSVPQGTYKRHGSQSKRKRCKITQRYPSSGSKKIVCILKQAATRWAVARHPSISNPHLATLSSCTQHHPALAPNAIESCLHARHDHYHVDTCKKAPQGGACKHPSWHSEDARRIVPLPLHSRFIRSFDLWHLSFASSIYEKDSASIIILQILQVLLLSALPQAARKNICAQMPRLRTALPPSAGASVGGGKFAESLLTCHQHHCKQDSSTICTAPGLHRPPFALTPKGSDWVLRNCLEY